MTVPAQIPVLNASGTPVNVNAPLDPGRAAATDSRPVVLSNEDFTKLSDILTKLNGSLAVTGTFFQATQPVSGTVTVTGVALDATLTGGTAKAIVRGGAKGITTAADITSTPSAANHQALDVALYDGSGNLLNPTQIRALTSADQVTIAASALPSGAATATNQTTLNGVFGTTADAAWTTGAGTAIALLKAIAGGILDPTPTAVKIDQTTPGTTDAVTVKSPSDKITFTPTLDTAIYASGDVLFATTSIAGVARANDQRAVLLDLAVIDKADQKPAFSIFFYQTNVASGAANAVPSISDTDAASYMGHVSIAAADYKDLGGVSVACKLGINMLLESVSGATNVYAVGVLDAGTPTFTASDLVIKLGVVQS